MYFLSGVQINKELKLNKSEDFLLKLRCIDYFKYIYKYYNEYLYKEYFIEGIEDEKKKKVSYKRMDFFDFNVSFSKVFLLFLSKKYKISSGKVGFSTYKFLFLLCKNLVSLFYFSSIKSVGVQNNQFSLASSRKYSFDTSFFLGLNSKFLNLSKVGSFESDSWFTLFLKLNSSSFSEKGLRPIKNLFTLNDSSFKYKRYLKFFLNSNLTFSLKKVDDVKSDLIDFSVAGSSFSKWVYYYYYYLRFHNYNSHYFYLFFVYLLLVSSKENKTVFSNKNKDVVISSYLVLKNILFSKDDSDLSLLVGNKENYLLSIKNAYRYLIEVSLNSSEVTKDSDSLFGFTFQRFNLWLSSRGSTITYIKNFSVESKDPLSNSKTILLGGHSALLVNSRSKSSFLIGIYYKLRFTNKFKSILKASNIVPRNYYYYKEYSLVLLYKNIRYTNEVFSSVSKFYKSYFKNLNLYYSILNYCYSGRNFSIDSLSSTNQLFSSSIGSMDIVLIIKLYLNYFRFSSFILGSSISMGSSSKLGFNYLTFIYNKLFYYWCYKNSFILDRLKYNFLYSLYYNNLNKIVVKLDDKSVYYGYLLYIYNDKLATSKKKVFKLSDKSRTIYNVSSTEYSYLDSYNYNKNNKLDSFLKLNKVQLKNKISFLFRSKLFGLFSNILLKDGKKTKFENIFHKLLSGLYVGTYGKNPLVLFMKLLTIVNNVFKLKSVSSFNQNSFIIKLYNTESQFKESFRQLVSLLNGDSTYYTSSVGSKLIGYLFNNKNSISYVRSLNQKVFNIEQKLLLLLLSVIFNNSSIYKEKIKLNKKTYQSLKNNSFFLTYGSNIRSRSNIGEYLNLKLNKYNPIKHSKDFISLLLSRYQNDIYFKKINRKVVTNKNIVVFSVLLKKLFNYFMFDQYKGSLVNGVINAKEGYGFYLDKIPVKEEKDFPIGDIETAKKFKEEFDSEDLLDKNYNSVEELVSTVMDTTLSGNEKSKVVNYISLLYCLVLKYIYYIDSNKKQLSTSYTDFLLQYLNVVLTTLNDSGVVFNYKNEPVLLDVLPSYLDNSLVDDFRNKSVFYDYKQNYANYKINSCLHKYYLDNTKIFSFVKSKFSNNSRVLFKNMGELCSNTLYKKYLSYSYKNYLKNTKLDLVSNNRLEVESNHYQ